MNNAAHPIDAQHSRRDRILAGIADRRRLVGVEIGALDKPLLLKTEGRVYYVDYTDTAALQARYAAFPDHDVENIVAIDAVWGARTLREALGEPGEAGIDFVVASHVIEHVPDVLGWLEEIAAVLKPGGTLHLAVPDRRYTFDIRRCESRMSDVLHAYVVKARAPLPHQILDFDMNFLAVDVQLAWRGQAEIPRHLNKNQVQHSIAVAREVIATGEYLDIHCWVFTPLSFALLMEQLAALEMLHFSCLSWCDTAAGELEFIVTLQKSSDTAANVASWRRMADGLSPPAVQRRGFLGRLK